MSRKFAHWYTVERWQKPSAEDAALFEESFGHQPYRLIYKSKDGTLFSKGHYPTKVMCYDLPPAFIFARIGKLFGYYDSSAVIGVAYKPNKWINHLLRDDLLLLSFDDATVGPDKWDSFDIVLSGWDIVECIAALDAYSNVSSAVIAGLRREVADKVRLYNKTYPDEHDCISEEVYWKHLEEAKQRIQKHRTSR